MAVEVVLASPPDWRWSAKHKKSRNSSLYCAMLCIKMSMVRNHQPILSYPLCHLNQSEPCCSCIFLDLSWFDTVQDLAGLSWAVSFSQTLLVIRQRRRRIWSSTSERRWVEGWRSSNLPVYSFLMFPSTAFWSFHVFSLSFSTIFYTKVNTVPRHRHLAPRLSTWNSARTQ